MLHDVVAAVAAWPRRPACALVTSDPFALELAREYDFEIIPDPANPGETGAIEMATTLCVIARHRQHARHPGGHSVGSGQRTRANFRKLPLEGHCWCLPPTDVEPTLPFAGPRIYSPCGSETTVSSHTLPRPRPAENLCIVLQLPGHRAGCRQSRGFAGTPDASRRNPHAETDSRVGARQQISCDGDGGSVSKARRAAHKPAAKRRKKGISNKLQAGLRLIPISLPRRSNMAIR